MSTEPERPIEKLLRAYAKKRREAGAPLELHPVNRRLLHGALASRKRKATPASDRVFSVLGRLLWAGAAAAVMAIIIALFVPALRTPDAELAKNELPLVTNSVEDLPPAAVAAEPDTGTLAQGATSLAMLDSKAANETPKEEAKGASLNGVPAAQPAALDSLAASRMPTSQNEPAAPAPVSAPAATPPASNDRQEKEALTLAQSTPAQTFNRLRFGAAKTDGVEGTAANKLADLPAQLPSTSSVLNFAAAPAPLPGSFDDARRGLATFDETAKKAKDLSASQYFARLGVPQQKSEKSASMPSVMNTFALERAGGEVRIIDGDGSVYTGYIQSNVKAPEGSASNAELGSAAGTMRAQQRKLSADADVTAGASLTNAVSYSFFVSGTNQTLKQLVSFSGRFQPSTNVFVATGVGGRAAAGAASLAQPEPLRQPSASIQGKLRIGGSPENDFQAVARP